MQNQSNSLKNMHLTRRRMLQGAAGVLAAGTIAVSQTVRGEDQPSAESEKAVVKGRLKQSVCAWCYKMKLDELAQNAAAIGLKSVELVDSKDWPILKKHGLICAMTPSHDIGEGFNNKDNHEKCIAAVKKSIDACVEAGFPNVITFSGNRNGMSDDVGLENTVEGLKNVIGYAEQKKVNVCIEILNSRLNHKDYMCDTVEWAAEVCKRIASPRMKILFDIYHVQVQQGDIIVRIKQFHEYIGHYHTAGVPGRHELDENQELNYPAIMRAIAESGFQGYIGQEFIPTRDPMKSLSEAVRLCDV
ncbi:MAG TPA: sugar phosphate isomerase/epimerase family protein [Thermoguttaceae bacterium]